LYFVEVHLTSQIHLKHSKNFTIQLQTSKMYNVLMVCLRVLRPRAIIRVQKFGTSSVGLKQRQNGAALISFALSRLALNAVLNQERKLYSFLSK
jgi:hypothetical protein